MPRSVFIQISLIFLFCLFSQNIFTQTGPGGVGYEDDSEENQPWNVLWLKADALDYSDGDVVLTWDDISGNGNDAVKMDEEGPLFHADAINGYPSVTFNGSNYMSIEDADNLDGGEGLSIFVVIKKNHDNVLGGRKFIAKRKHWNVWTYEPSLSPSDIQYSYGLDYRDTEEGTRIDCHINGNLDDIKNRVSTDNIYGDTTKAYVVDYTYNGNWAFLRINGETNAYPGGVNPRPVSIGPVIQGTADLWIGAAQLDPPGHKSADEGITVESFLNANISEIIIYRNGLDSCQIVIVENYLASKYDLELDPVYKYYHDSIYHKSVFGIGTIDGNKKHSSASDRILQFQEMEATINEPNEFLFAGSNQNQEITKDTSFIPDTVQYRWSKIWKIEKQGTLDAMLSFNFSEAGMIMDNADDYVLLYSADDDTGFTVLSNKGQRKFASLQYELPNEDVNSGYYTLGYLATSIPSSISLSEFENSTRLYPNPVTENSFTIEIWNNYTGFMDICVYDLLGKQITYKKLKKDVHHYKHQLKINAKNGAYVVQIKTNHGTFEKLINIIKH